jgi:hypothetical protein
VEQVRVVLSEVDVCLQSCQCLQSTFATDSGRGGDKDMEGGGIEVARRRKASHRGPPHKHKLPPWSACPRTAPMPPPRVALANCMHNKARQLELRRQN